MSLTKNGYKVLLGILLFGLAAIPGNLFAQPELEWSRIYDNIGSSTGDTMRFGGAGNRIIRTSQGEYAITGITVNWSNNDNTYLRPYLLTLSEIGWPIEWVVFTEIPHYSGGFQVKELESDNFLITAAWVHTYALGIYGEYWDYYVIGTDGAETIWWTSIANRSVEYIQVHSEAIPTEDGGFLIGALSYDENIPDVYTPTLYKFNGEGVQEWSRSYDDSLGTLKAVIDLSSNELLHIREHGVLKTNYSGDPLWSKTLPYNVDYINETLDGGFIIVQNGGWDWDQSASPDTVRKTDSDLIPIWSKSFENTLSQYSVSYIYEIFESPDGGFLLSTRNDHSLTKLNWQGDSLWAINFEELYGLDGLRAESVLYPNDSTLIITGAIEGIDLSSIHDPLWVGKFSFSPIQTHTVESDLSPSSFQLFHNYPNPFNPTTAISYDLPAQSEVNLTIYDVTGREVRTLQSKELPSGRYEVQWNGVDESGNPVNTGVYFARLKAGSFSKTIKMLYLK